ncbi:tyrosine-type recombinase/integrase [Prosthecobacter sp.]|uniref:tyrosine-type recombinase/integrase n=1 Tax=Prosthecobacter sp. TaxID=1965333 RepID=UPI002ABC408E|nr:tyrosine-type recombinase/integrase [Prosthecobacter sp.]MDZ4403897.1 tyrosine-type recombinase/integrase [Prosthecobacter sp.]
MASTFTRPNSLFYYAAFRLPVTDASGKKGWKLVKKVTKVLVGDNTSEQNKNQQKALKIAMEFEQNAFRAAGAGDEGSLRILAILREAADKAAQKRLTANLGRDYIRRLVEASTGEALPAEKTIAGWFNEWLKLKTADTKPATQARYKASVKAILTHLGEEQAVLPLDSLTIGKLREFRDKLKAEGRTAKTTNHYLKDVNSALLAAAKEGHISRSPADNLEPLPEEDSTSREPLTFVEISKILKAAPSEDWRGIILLAAFGGLRLGDAARMTRDRIDLQEKVIRFIPQKTTRQKLAKKGKKASTLVLPMHAELVGYFESIELPADLTAPVFPSLARVSVAGKHGLSTGFIRIMAKAGVSRGETREHIAGTAGRSAHSLSFHSLRHTFNSSMFNSGVSQETRMKLVGHADTKTNAGYTHAELAALRSAVDKVPALKRKRA